MSCSSSKAPRSLRESPPAPDTVRYRAIDLVRRDDNHAPERASDERPAPDDVSENAIARDDARRLHASLTLLSDEQQEVITLAYFGQLSHTEIATQLGLAPAAVKGRMRLGLQKLRTNIEQAAA